MPRYHQDVDLNHKQLVTVSIVISSLWGGGGGNFHRLGYGMCHFLRVLFLLKKKIGSILLLVINFRVKILAWNKFLGQIVMKH